MEKTPFARTVHYYETDRMGIVHHSNYLRFFEEARVDWLARLGIPYEVFEQRGMLSPLLTSACAYHKPLTFGEPFCVHLALTQYNGLRMTLAYRVERTTDGALCATGETAHCFVQAQTFRPLRLQRAFPAAHEALLAAAEKEAHA